MFLHQIDLTTALRPSLLPDETLLFVQDGVGLYEGKYKIPQYQNGQAYLTSHRACYIDHEDPRKNSVAVNLKDLDHSEFYAGFLKSSAKITLIPKADKRSPLVSRGSSPYGSTARRHESPGGNLSPSPASGANATWVCPICSFSNPIPPNFDPVAANSRTPLQPCQACGIKPPLMHVVKAAITSLSNRQPSPGDAPRVSPDRRPSFPVSAGTFRCPRCTFENHPSLLSCEICGASLVTAPDPRLELGESIERAESPGPTLKDLSINDDRTESIKFSFRAGGEKIFFERLKGALVQRKWLLEQAPPIPEPVQPGSSAQSGSSTPGAPAQKMVGIAGLELRGQELRKNNEKIIGNAFEDLEALMTSAKEVIALAESFSSQARQSNGMSSEEDARLWQSASALGLATTKDMLGSDALYVSELSRNLAEFLTDDGQGILKRAGGIIPLVDLWAMFNRIRNGVELVSPTDFEKAAQMWDKLKLPIRLRRFKSGLLAVQGRDHTEEKTISSILAWLRELHNEPPDADVRWDLPKYGRGIMAQEAAAKFGWSIGVATEELEMAEEKGALCRELGLDGLRFWENWLIQMPPVL